MLQTFEIQQWNERFSDQQQGKACQSLENNQLLFFPHLKFVLNDNEQQFLTPHYADPNAKNISYDARLKKLWGVRELTDKQHSELKNMMARFHTHACQLVKSLLPSYAEDAIPARTSFRPIEISGRKTSPRKNDTLLHVDAFPSAPNQGKRILRVFSNVNPKDARLWNVGESFENVAKKFIPHIRRPLPGSAALLRFLKITKSYRTLYDHYMLQLHNQMKADASYQQAVAKHDIAFAPGTSWVVMTDQVSHAAIRGCFVFEQTFYIPVAAMQDETRSPLRVLEKMLGHRLA